MILDVYSLWTQQGVPWGETWTGHGQDHRKCVRCGAVLRDDDINNRVYLHLLKCPGWRTEAAKWALDGKL